MPLLRPMRFSYPRSPSQGYGNTTNVNLAPQAPSIPFESGAGLAHGGARGAVMAPGYPTPAAPVTTNPSLTPFQLSLNNERAQTAMKAATFAKAAPLPMSPMPTPAMQPTQGAPTMPSPGMAQPATMPMGQVAETPQAPAAPQMQYSGAFGTGPQAQKTAQAARDAYVQSHTDTANAQDRGPGLGVNSYANAQLQQDANQRANDAADTPNAKDEYYQAGAAERQARADTLIPAQAGAAKAKGESTAALTQPKADNLAAGTAATKAKGDAATANAETNKQRALTAEEARKDRKLSEGIKTREQELRSNNRLDASAKRDLIHLQLADLYKKRQIAINAGIRTDDPGGINDQITNAMKQVLQTPATQPAGGVGGVPLQNVPAGQVGGGPATQPSASAGQLNGHDPANLTPENLQHTAVTHGITVDEVKRRLGVA